VPRSALIVDSGLRSLGGHNFTYTSSLSRQLRERGWAVEVAASARLEAQLAAETGFRPALSLSAYDFAPGRGLLRDLAFVHAQSVVHAEELEGVLRALGPERFDLVFSPTLGDFELLAWRKVVRRIPLRGSLFVLLRNTPGYRARPPWTAWLHPYLRIRPRALAELRARMRGRFALLTDSDLLARDYAHVHRHRILTVPIPIGESILQRNGASFDALAAPRHGFASSVRHVAGYLGDARPAKGFDLLPALIRSALSKGPSDVGYLIQCPPPSSAPIDVEDPAVASLRSLAGQEPGRVRIVAERLSEGAYAELLADMDIVLIPYRRAGYVEPTSGIFAEAVALSKPVIVPSGTWMSHSLSRAGAGIEFESGKPADLERALLEALGRLDELRSAAVRGSGAWAAFHNGGRLADMLIAECENQA
jgi:glycosyltransferase involved in cell wall biosynthesis